jgi:two-component sensor histidine kinase
MNKPYIPTSDTCQMIQKFSNELASIASQLNDKADAVQRQVKIIKEVSNRVSYIAETTERFIEPSPDSNWKGYYDTEDVIQYHSRLTVFTIKEKTSQYNDSIEHELFVIRTLKDDFAAKVEDFRAFMSNQSADNNHSF